MRKPGKEQDEGTEAVDKSENMDRDLSDSSEVETGEITDGIEVPRGVKALNGGTYRGTAYHSVMELINQSVEEYRDRLEAGKLEIVVSQRGDLSILADGRLMWRIMDNLLNNVVKYALPGTRVYVTAQKFENRIVIAVKNISREPLNVDAEELMERFVRGDSSRHTEGTGLGLNIARSLTVLQNGQFSLTVDGDFFKAEIFMPVA
jgi:signal transduction histidine kinase